MLGGCSQTAWEAAATAWGAAATVRAWGATATATAWGREGIWGRGDCEGTRRRRLVVVVVVVATSSSCRGRCNDEPSAHHQLRTRRAVVVHACSSPPGKPGEPSVGEPTVVASPSSIPLCTTIGRTLGRTFRQHIQAEHSAEHLGRTCRQLTPPAPVVVRSSSPRLYPHRCPHCYPHRS